jgi:hypothetical protein
MMGRKVFYSFHYKNDVFRVQQIRKIGALEDNKPVSVNKWEEVKKGGDRAIKKWIDESLYGRSCAVVLVGEKTAKRGWIRHEIEKAWNDGKGVVGIYIHNVKCMQQGCCAKGENPFLNLYLGRKKLSDVVKCYNPKADNAYKDIKDNIHDWIEEAIEIRNNFKNK